MFPYGQPPVTPPDPDPDVDKPTPPGGTPWLPWEKKVWAYTAFIAAVLIYSIILGASQPTTTCTATTTRQDVDSGHGQPQPCETTTTTGR